MEDHETAQLRREEIRLAVRTHLYERPGIAQSCVTIRRALAREYNCSAEEVQAACLFLESVMQVDAVREPLGATIYYRINANGTLAHERGI